MLYRLPDLPYPPNALAPRISAETLEYHWGKHHRGYVDGLNKLITGTRFAEQPLEQVVRRSSGAVFNNAAQHFNHSVYWQSLDPQGGGEPSGPLGEALVRRYRSFEEFRAAFSQAATALFGSGWCWLVLRKDGALDVRPTHDGDCPLSADETPLLACDVWEHAYYIDYRNARVKYV